LRLRVVLEDFDKPPGGCNKEGCSMQGSDDASP
jgi:hypothetical protein